MKAILVLDEMPSSCEECVLRNEGACFPVSKQNSICGVYYTMKEGRRPNWCPLKPMVGKKSNGETFKVAIENDCYDGTTEDKAYFAGYDKGYNTCIDEILGDKE